MICKRRSRRKYRNRPPAAVRLSDQKRSELDARAVASRGPNRHRQTGPVVARQDSFSLTPLPGGKQALFSLGEKVSAGPREKVSAVDKKTELMYGYGFFWVSFSPTPILSCLKRKNITKWGCKCQHNYMNGRTSAQEENTASRSLLTFSARAPLLTFLPPIACSRRLVSSARGRFSELVSQHVK